MTINRIFWLKSFPKDKIPNWPCPRCGQGILQPVQNSFCFGEKGDITAEKVEQGDYFDYDVYEFHYSVLLKCNNPDCQEHVGSCGEGLVEEEALEFDIKGNLLKSRYYEVFYPKFFYPALPIFPIPKECPNNVANEIKNSFKLFFADPPASANYVRKVVEEILTERGVKRFTLDKKRKRVKISLHDRIVQFEKNKPEVAKNLFAIKWLGNEGSHSTYMKANDLLDAYEILEIILDDLYVGYRKSIQKKVFLINESKRPLHPSS